MSLGVPVSLISQQATTLTACIHRYLWAAGMNIYAAIFIIPFTVVLYTSTGGLKVRSHIQRRPQAAHFEIKIT